MAEKKFTVSGEQRDDIDGQMLEIKHQLRLKGGCPIDPELVKVTLQKIVEGKFGIKENILSQGQTILIDACDGTETLADAKDVFPVQGVPVIAMTVILSASCLFFIILVLIDFNNLI